MPWPLLVRLPLHVVMPSTATPPPGRMREDSRGDPGNLLIAAERGA